MGSRSRRQQPNQESGVVGGGVESAFGGGINIVKTVGDEGRSENLKAQRQW